MNRNQEFETLRLGDQVNHPHKGNRVKVHYDVYISKSKKRIESSRDEGEPYEFMLGRGEIVDAWEQVLPKMSLGQKVRFECRPNQIFGSRFNYNSEDRIVFILELISFV